METANSPSGIPTAGFSQESRTSRFPAFSILRVVPGTMSLYSVSSYVVNGHREGGAERGCTWDGAQQGALPHPTPRRRRLPVTHSPRSNLREKHHQVLLDTKGFHTSAQSSAWLSWTRCWNNLLCHEREERAVCQKGMFQSRKPSWARHTSGHVAPQWRMAGSSAVQEFPVPISTWQGSGVGLPLISHGGATLTRWHPTA